MEFKTAESVRSTCWYLKLADLRRADNRAKIDSLFNGMPPYSAEEVQANRIQTNVNDLTATRSAHAMRRQFASAFLRPGNFFNVKCDYGPQHKRREVSEIITQRINGQMKRGYSAAKYGETQRNKFASVTLHGVGPSEWDNKGSWCPSMRGMGDVMIPSMTYRDMSNLSHFAIYRRYTAWELYEKTHGPRVDKAWNVEVANACIQWAMKQTGQTMAPTDYAYSPERWQEAIKDQSGLYNSDQIPTINVWDFYHTDLNKKDYGWKRCMILDAPDEAGGEHPSKTNRFLYNATSRSYASKLSEILHFQFADGSVVAPFLYHSVRSLGFLLYAVCHLQNRIYCKFHDNVFENLMQYFRVSNPNDAERLQKIDLQNYGLIPDGLTMVPRNDRFQTDANLINMAMAMNRSMVAESAASYSQDFGFNDSEKPEKTATQITAELNATTSMVGSMLGDAYGYEETSDQEICRRFCIPNSKDPDVREARKNILRDLTEAGVSDPEKALDVSRWEVTRERVIGAGNKQLELGMVGQLMEIYPLLDPSAQRQVIRLKVFSATDDAALTQQLVPNEPDTTTSSTHDAELSSAVLLQGTPMGLKEGVSHEEYAATLIGILNTEVQKVNQMGGITDQAHIMGMQNLAGQTIEGQPIPGNGAASHIAILAQDENAKPTVKKLNDVLSKLMNEVRAFQQRLEEAQAQQQQGANGQPPLTPEDAVKLKSQLLVAQVKADSMAEAHAQRSQQRADIHQQNLREKQDKAQLANANEIRKTQVDEAATDLKTSAEILRTTAKAEAEPKDKSADK